MLKKLFLFLIVAIVVNNHVLLLNPEDSFVQEIAKFAVEKINKENEYESSRPSLSLIRVTQVSRVGDVYDFAARLKEANCKRNCPIDICDITVSVFNGEKVMERRKCFLIRGRPRN